MIDDDRARESSVTHQPLLANKLFWVGLLYFAEGFPLGVFYEIFPVYFRQQGIELRQIGVLSLLGLAWTLKFLWAPAIDYWRHHRRWMAGADVAMGCAMLYFAVQAGFGPAVWIAIGVFTALSATNDIAVDGYTIEYLDKEELGPCQRDPHRPLSRGHARLRLRVDGFRLAGLARRIRARCRRFLRARRSVSLRAGRAPADRRRAAAPAPNWARSPARRSRCRSSSLSCSASSG